MQIAEVLEIFEKKKQDYLRKIMPDEHPVGVLLGGQGAVGKGQLNHWAEELYPDKHFLFINGDIYRSRHPRFKDLQKDTWNFSQETQIFSNVFTEKLIEESIQNRFSFVVEGTMRSVAVPLRTAELLRSNGYETAAFAIAACKEYSLLNAFVRYFKEVQAKGFGRMIDIDSHNKAVEGMPLSLDKLFAEKSVDRISIFDCFAKNKVADYRLIDGKWDNETLPSAVIKATRESQLKDKQAVEALLDEASKVLERLDDERIKVRMRKAYEGLKDIVSAMY